jgi:hypothetical protein
MSWASPRPAKGTDVPPEASHTIYPLQQTCENIHCPKRLKCNTLKKAEQREAVLYTLDKGALPAYVVHLYCEGMLYYVLSHLRIWLRFCHQAAVSIIITIFVSRMANESTMMEFPMSFKLVNINLLSEG